MKSSSDIALFIMGFEDFRPNTYECPNKKKTIGIGHVILPHERFVGNKITFSQAIQVFKRDLIEKEIFINNYVRVPLSQGQFDALISLSFNCGSNMLYRSPTFQKLNKGDYESVVNNWFHEINGIVRSKGKILIGLQRRRREEYNKFWIR